MTSPPRLIVLPPSHFLRKGSLGIELNALAYSEVRWAVGCHVPLASRLAPATTLPMLVSEERVIQGSGPILDWANVPGGDAKVQAVSSAVSVRWCPNISM